MSVPAGEALRAAAARLAATSDTPRLDAELLMAHAAGMSREELILKLRDLDEPAGFAALVARRLAHEPVAQITGKRDFWTLTLAVSRHVLTPRPDSETLIEAAVEHFAGAQGPRRILDLGTGSGALLLAALDEWRGAQGLGVDRDVRALDIARANAVACGMADRARFALGDWCAGLAESEAAFDLILCNPPYIAQGTMLPSDVRDYEPHGALFAGEDGLDAYRILCRQIAPLLAPGGIALFEIGFDQGESAATLFRAQELAVTLRRDLAGHARCLLVTQKPTANE